jgi:hypothetical protein
VTFNVRCREVAALPKGTEEWRAKQAEVAQAIREYEPPVFRRVEVEEDEENADDDEGDTE